MTLTPFERRRAAAVLIVAAIVLVVCFATGNAIAGAVLLALTPAVVYRVTGRSWRPALSRASGQEATAPPDVAPVGPAGSRGRRTPGSGERIGAIATLAVVVPVALGLLSALVGRVVGMGDAILAIGIVMTLSWTGFAGMLSGLVVGSAGPRRLIALAAGAATALSVGLWVSVVGG